MVSSGLQLFSVFQKSGLKYLQFCRKIEARALLLVINKRLCKKTAEGWLKRRKMISNRMKLVEQGDMQISLVQWIIHFRLEDRKNSQIKMKCAVVCIDIFWNLATGITKISKAKDFIFLSKKHIHYLRRKEKKKEKDNQTKSFQKHFVTSYVAGKQARSSAVLCAVRDVTLNFIHLLIVAAGPCCCTFNMA